MNETKQTVLPKEVRYNDTRGDVEIVGGSGFARLMGFDGRSDCAEADAFGNALATRYNFHERLKEALRELAGWFDVAEDCKEVTRARALLAELAKAEGE